MKEQGYPINRKLFYQDNMSAIHIEMNGSASSSEKLRHIDIKFFFIKDIKKREDIEVKNCPTECMISDFFTNPLQGKLFKYLKDIVMVLETFPMEEHVGLYDNKLYDNIPKNSIVEECNHDIDSSQPSIRKMAWAEIVTKNERKRREIV